MQNESIISSENVVIDKQASEQENLLLIILISCVATIAGLAFVAASYDFYTVCAFISIGFVVKFVHEAKGTELENMEG